MHFVLFYCTICQYHEELRDSRRGETAAATEFCANILSRGGRTGVYKSVRCWSLFLQQSVVHYDIIVLEFGLRADFILHWWGGATNVQHFALILSKVEPIFSRKWVWSQFLINLLLLENVLSPLIQSGSSRNQFIVGKFQTRLVPHLTRIVDIRPRRRKDVSPLSRLSTVSSVRHPLLPGSRGYFLFIAIK